MAFIINRRTALAGAAALAAFPANAQDKKVIVGTWGGDYSRLLTKNVDSLMKGTECVHAEENADPRKAFPATLIPRRGNSFAITALQRQSNWVAAALARAGSGSNFEPGKERLIACRKAGARIYPSNEAFAQALKTGEIACGIMWKARAVQWQNAGIKVATVAPKEGVPMYISGFSVPKNAPSKDGAYAWLNAMMAASAQENFAIDMGYNPTVTNAKVAPDLQARIGCSEEEQKRLVDLDYGYMGKNDIDFQDWWNKSFKG